MFQTVDMIKAEKQDEGLIITSEAESNSWLGQVSMYEGWWMDGPKAKIGQAGRLL